MIYKKPFGKHFIIKWYVRELELESLTQIVNCASKSCIGRNAKSERLAKRAQSTIVGIKDDQLSTVVDQVV